MNKMSSKRQSSNRNEQPAWICSRSPQVILDKCHISTRQKKKKNSTRCRVPELVSGMLSLAAGRAWGIEGQSKEQLTPVEAWWD